VIIQILGAVVLPEGVEEIVEKDLIIHRDSGGNFG